MFEIYYKKQYILVLLNKKIFIKQEYIKNKSFTIFYVIHWLSKYGFKIKK